MSQGDFLQRLADAPMSESRAFKVKRSKAKRGQAKGWAAPPGSGPAGETCKSCANKRANDMQSGRRFWKCALVRWTGGPGTDIRLAWPACSRWRRAEG